MVTMVMTMVRLIGSPMRTIKASEFKAKCLKLMDEVQTTGEEIVVTKNGTAVAKLVAMPKKGGRFTFGVGRGKLEIVGDIVKRPDILWDFNRWPKVPAKAKSATRAKGKHVAAR
jgi:prevent-host-death family protein